MNALPVEPRITEYLYRRASAAGIPLSGTFELTPVCNMDCKMCYVRLSADQQRALGPLADADQWLALGRQAMESGMLYLLLTGGEPFLHPQFREIMEGLHRMGLLISINSNGTLIDADTVAWLKNTPPVRMNISLYGASDDTYARLCGNPHGFTQVKRAIRLLTEAGIAVKLNVSLTPHNAADLPSMVEFARANGLMLQIATYMFPPVRRDAAAVGRNDRFSPEEAAYYMAYADYLTLGAERFAAQTAPTPSDVDDSCAEVGEGIRCRAGKCSFWVNWQGYMTPCGMFPVDNSPCVFVTPLGAAWEQVKAYAAGVRLPSVCADCEAKDVCRACAAMVITESGRFDTVPAYRCTMMRAYRDQWNRVKEEWL